MKAYVRVKYVGDVTINFGVHGELTPGTEFSLGYKEVEYLENSIDGFPDYLSLVKGSESDKKKDKDVPDKDPTALLNALRAKDPDNQKNKNKTKADEYALMSDPRLALLLESRGIEFEGDPTREEVIKALLDDDQEEVVKHYSEWNAKDLKAELTGRELKVEGRFSKVKAVAALEANDAKADESGE